MHVLPLGMVTTIVNVEPSLEDRTSINPPFAATPMAIGFSEYFDERKLKIVLRLPQLFSSVPSAPPGVGETANISRAESRKMR